MEDQPRPSSSNVEMEEDTHTSTEASADATLPLLDLPAPFLREVLLALWQDPRDVAALSCCCTAALALTNDQLLWREIVLRRYGPNSCPGLPPTPGQQALL